METLTENTAYLESDKGIVLKTAGKYIPHDINVKLRKNFKIGETEITDNLGALKLAVIENTGELAAGSTEFDSTDITIIEEDKTHFAGLPSFLINYSWDLTTVGWISSASISDRKEYIVRGLKLNNKIRPDTPFSIAGSAYLDLNIDEGTVILENGSKIDEFITSGTISKITLKNQSSVGEIITDGGIITKLTNNSTMELTNTGDISYNSKSTGNIALQESALLNISTFNSGSAVVIKSAIPTIPTVYINKDSSGTIAFRY